MSKWSKKGEVLCEDTLVLGTISWNNLVGLRICTSWLDAFRPRIFWKGKGWMGESPSSMAQISFRNPLLQRRMKSCCGRESNLRHQDLQQKKSLAGGCSNHENAIQIIRSSASTKFISWQAKEIPLASDMVWLVHHVHPSAAMSHVNIPRIPRAASKLLAPVPSSWPLPQLKRSATWASAASTIRRKARRNSSCLPLLLAWCYWHQRPTKMHKILDQILIWT